MYTPNSSVFGSPRYTMADSGDRAPASGLIPARWLVAAVLASFAALVALMAETGLRVDPTARASIPFYIVIAGLAGIRYAMRRPATRTERRLRDASEFFGIFVPIVLIGAIACYPVSAQSHGFVDRGLQRIDAALRFDWIAWYDLVAAHRSLQLLGTAAYQSIFVSPAILLGHYALTGRRAEARGFIAAFWVAAVLSLALFRFIPAEGPLAFLWRGPIPYMPDSALYEAQIIPLLRDHALHYVDLGALRGLVSAPSFHTASVVLFIAAAWPQRSLRWPLTLLNLAMLLSTPVEGTHYLSDMLAGAGVALAALWIVARLRARLPAG